MFSKKSFNILCLDGHIPYIAGLSAVSLCNLWLMLFIVRACWIDTLMKWSVSGLQWIFCVYIFSTAICGTSFMSWLQGKCTTLFKIYSLQILSDSLVWLDPHVWAREWFHKLLCKIFCQSYTGYSSKKWMSEFCITFTQCTTGADPTLERGQGLTGSYRCT